MITEHGEIPLDLEHGETPDLALRGPAIGLQRTEVEPPRQVYEYPVTPDRFPWFYDRELWLEVLDTLLEQRANVIYLWSGHPFASFVQPPEFPEALEVTPAELAANRELLTWLVDQAARRGVTAVLDVLQHPHPAPVRRAPRHPAAPAAADGPAEPLHPGDHLRVRRRLPPGRSVRLSRRGAAGRPLRHRVVHRDDPARRRGRRRPGRRRRRATDPAACPLARPEAGHRGDRRPLPGAAHRGEVQRRVADHLEPAWHVAGHPPLSRLAGRHPRRQHPHPLGPGAVQVRLGHLHPPVRPGDPPPAEQRRPAPLPAVLLGVADLARSRRAPAPPARPGLAVVRGVAPLRLAVRP